MNPIHLTSILRQALYKNQALLPQRGGKLEGERTSEKQAKSRQNAFAGSKPTQNPGQNKSP